MRIRAIRGFVGTDGPVPVGAELEVELGFGRLLVASGKAEALEDAPPTAAGPTTTETAGELVPGRQRERKRAS